MNMTAFFKKYHVAIIAGAIIVGGAYWYHKHNSATVAATPAMPPATPATGSTSFTGQSNFTGNLNFTAQCGSGKVRTGHGGAGQCGPLPTHPTCGNGRLRVPKGGFCG